MKVHFDAQCKGKYFNGLPECGSYRNKNVTTDPSKVTCDLCRKTKIFKEAVK